MHFMIFIGQCKEPHNVNKKYTVAMKNTTVSFFRIQITQREDKIDTSLEALGITVMGVIDI